MNQEKIGKFIAKERKNMKMTQEEFAAKIGVSNKTISRWEVGKSVPDISLFNDICKVLKISINELLSGERLSKQEYQRKLEENIIGTIDYTNKVIKRKDIFSYVFGLLLGVILIMTAMFIYPGDVGIRSYYLVLATYILTMIYFIIINKLVHRNVRKRYFVLVIGTYFIWFILIMLFNDYINFRVNDIPPRKASIEFGMTGIKYDSVFYSAYKCNTDETYTFMFRNNKSVDAYCAGR